ncbi:hypothetical protein Tco_1058621 [Tanacetum coccineum]|uniref:Uncharacterized protein n=1 Tax=Tanacetum coccineum TaxID=301880 RepID=A0ABQ5H8W3_9ASTR
MTYPYHRFSEQVGLAGDLGSTNDVLILLVRTWTVVYWYCEDIDYFKDFENEFPVIVYKDALISEPEVSSEPTVSVHNVKKVDFDFVISFDESDDEDYTFTYDKDSFSYKLVSVNDLKSDSDNDDDKVDIKKSSRDISVEPLPDVINAFATHNLAHKRNMEDHIEQIFYMSQFSGVTGLRE